MNNILKFVSKKIKVTNTDNDHIFHMTRANIGVCLTHLKDLDTELKFKYIKNLDSVHLNVNENTDHFKVLLSACLADILNDCYNHLGNSQMDIVIDGLFKHFNLRVLQ